MKKILKSLFAALVMLCILQPRKVQAADHYTVIVRNIMTEESIAVFEVEIGDSILDAFKKKPQYLEWVSKDNGEKIPTFYKDTSYTVYDPTTVLTGNLGLYVTYSHAINSVSLNLPWPSAGMTAIPPEVLSKESNPHYSVSQARWLKNKTDTMSYTGKFVENQKYWVEIWIYPKETYALNYYNDTLKVKINGYAASYTKNKVPDEGIKILFEVKIDDKVEAFVRRVYMNTLWREPDPSGFKNWVTKLKNKTAKAADIIYGFFNSAEFKAYNFDDDFFVEDCYNVMMNRAPDAGGKKQWLEKLENGVSRNYVLKGFVDSKEFHNLCAQYGIEPGTITLTEARDQNYGITSFVARCYTKALERKFDVGGLNTWCKKILDASNKKQTAIDTAANGFFHSAEFVGKNHSDDKYVTILYHTFLNREPDTGGFSNWVNKLKNGTSRDEVLYGFAYSAEFAKLMANYGIK